MKNIIEYIWLDGYGKLRSKTRIIESYYEISKADSCSNWNYDGSSTNQADGNDSEVILKPKAIFNDPFRGKVLNFCYVIHIYLIWTLIQLIQGVKQLKHLIEDKGLKPMFGIEQEFFISKNGKPRIH